MGEHEQLWLPAPHPGVPHAVHVAVKVTLNEPLALLAPPLQLVHSLQPSNKVS